jgi:hypothetical protein
MEPIQRRNFLKSIFVAVAAMFVRPFHAVAGILPKVPLDPVTPLLRTEDFEEGRVDIGTVDSRALVAMLRDLRERHQYDASCHDGEPGPHSEYLAQWIGHVSDELHARGHSSIM